MKQKHIIHKICLSGDTGVGKSSIVKRYIHEQFEEFNEATIGAAFFSKDIHYPDYILKLQIWDTAGQERYRSLGPLYFRGCVSIILVINGIESASLDKSHSWINQVRAECPEVYIILAINKSDLDLEITEENLKEVCQIYGNMDYLYVSAKSGDNIEKLFKMSSQNHIIEEPKSNVITLSQPEKNKNSWWCSII